MIEPTPRHALPHASYERFDSLQSFELMFDELVQRTEQVIRIFDRSLSPAFNTSARCTLIREFLRKDALNRVYIVLHEPDNLPRAVPRFVAVLQQFSHGVSVRQTPRSARHLYDPFTIFDASHYLHRFHHEHMRFVRGMNELAGARALLDRYAELWDVSTPTAATTVLGL